jgi:hypothetical protein
MERPVRSMKGSLILAKIYAQEIVLIPEKDIKRRSYMLLDIRALTKKNKVLSFHILSLKVNFT